MIRIVNVSSEAHRWRKGVIWDDLNMEKMDYDHGQAYTQSKVANIHHAMELAKKLKDSGILAFSLHPGTVNIISWNVSGKSFSFAALFHQVLWTQNSLRSLVVEIWAWDVAVKCS